MKRMVHKVVLTTSHTLEAKFDQTAGVPRPIGYLMGLSGVAYIIQGWVLGSEGFSAAFTLPAVIGVVLAVAWSGWLLFTSWPMGASRARRLS